jgi:hypothetical protein
MRSKVSLLNIVLCAVAATQSVEKASAATPIGSVVAIVGEANASGPGGSRSLSAGSEVFEGDSVSVTGNGNAQLKLDDGTKLVVGPSSRLVLQTYLRRTKTTASTVGVKALRGTYRFITGNSSKSAYAVNTSNATIGIRGTGFDFSVTDRTYVAVLNGGVSVQGSNGETVEVSAGCGLGQAGGSGIPAKLLGGKPKGKTLVEELPYVLDQTPLQRQFYLAVGDCEKFLPPNIKPKQPNAASPG